MIRNREKRRAMRRKAESVAAKLAACCCDFQSGGLVPVTHPLAVAALTRAFTLVLRAGGEPVAIPLSEAEANAFPRYRQALEPGTVTWLAAGLDPDERGTYALQSAGSTDRGDAHDAARAMALARLAETAATADFPGQSKGAAA
ncbi:hypothetical protein [Frigidibacter sp. MR17.24]|uniref:hypothetical protein n=1 Tax=Frigidibacter sp. MR17.24 TaxID=3127345 RepID=UPI003012C486